MLSRGQRGQTLPFWAGATFIVLAMFAFVSNYVNTIGWQFHSQNAADAAASAGLSVYTNFMNEETTLLYASAIDEYRIRAVNQAMLNAMNGYGGCQGNGTVLDQPHCDSDYAALYHELYALVQGDAQHDAAQGDFDRDIRNLHNFVCPDSDPSGNYSNCLIDQDMESDEANAVTSFGSGCGSLSTSGFDCNFTYNVIQSGTPQLVTECATSLNCYLQQVDVIACRQVPFILGKLLGLPAGSYVPRVVGRSAYGVVPLNPRPFTPSETQQPAESSWTVNGQEYTLSDPGNQYYDLDFKGLTLDLLWYTTSVEDPSTLSGWFGTKTAATYSGNANPQILSGLYGCKGAS